MSEWIVVFMICLNSSDPNIKSDFLISDFYSVCKMKYQLFDSREDAKDFIKWNKFLVDPTVYKKEPDE